MNRILLVVLTFFCFSCERLNNPMEPDSGNFPDGSQWETMSPSSLGITDQELKTLREMLTNNNSRAFLLLKDGKIVVEEYFGKELNSSKDFNKESFWYWASAGKTLTAFTVGLAQEKGHLKISQKTSDFLGKGWTSMPTQKEDLITVRHQLTMTSGMDIKQDADCWKPECLKYVADAGTRWDYHNAPYTLLDQVVSKASGEKFDDFFNENLRDKIGMDGFWQYVGDNHVYFSTPRSMARFGLLILNRGDWDGVSVMQDKTYFEEMISTSQNLNASYGYLWWLNGHTPTMFPGIPLPFNRWITPNAPDEMIAAMGKNGQILNLIPSENLIVVRMGDASDDGQVGLQIQEDIWNLLNEILD